MMTICLKAALKNKLIHEKSFLNYDLVKKLDCIFLKHNMPFVGLELLEV